MRTRIIAVAVAAVLAIAGAGALVVAMQGASQSAAAGTRLAAVLVVVDQIPAGTSGEDAASHVVVKKMPAAYVVDGTVDSTSDLAGLVSTVALVPGEQMLASRWVTPAQLSATGGRIEAPEGTQELSLALDLERVAGGAIQAGSRVGIFTSVGGETGLLYDQVLVTALASTVDPDADGESTQGTVLVTFAVTAEQAAAIVNAAEFGKIWLSLQESR